MTERQALKELRSGSEEALGWFIHQYTPYVTTVIGNIIGTYMSVSDIEEVAADVFFALWENARQVHSPKGFLGTVSRNKAKNKLRELSDDLPLMANLLAADTLDLEEQAEMKELAAVVKRAVLVMRQPEKEIFLRYYYYYQTLEEIAGEMRIPLSTVKSKLRRGKMKLKESLLRYLI